MVFLLEPLTMEIIQLHDKAQILSFLMQNPELQVYSIGDLDDFFWPDTAWYALCHNSEVRAIALLYYGLAVPTLLAFYEKESFYTSELLKKIKTFLPEKYYAHLSPGLMNIYDEKNMIEYYGPHYKMALRATPSVIQEENIRRLSVKDLSNMQELYGMSYPDNWFDQRMLKTGKYFGYFVGEKIVGTAGIHVYSRKYKVAALGNITTHPEYRNKQIGYKLTSALCHDLHESVDYIGLNVKADNHAAIHCYRKVGFEVIGMYDECYFGNSPIS